MHIIKEYIIEPNQLEEFEKLKNECQNYEAYLDLNLPYYLAYEKDRLVGFLSYIIVNDEAEISAMVSPAFRRLGIFTALMKEALLDEPLCSCATRIGTFADDMLRSSLCSRPAYSELLLSLGSENSSMLPLPDTSGYDLCYLENDGVYLVYDTHEDTDDSSDIYSNDEAVGSLNLNYSHSYSCIFDVNVIKERRKQGLGTMMMLSFIKEYFQTNDLPLILNVRSTNTAAVSLYKKCGFTEVSHIDYYYI